MRDLRGIQNGFESWMPRSENVISLISCIQMTTNLFLFMGGDDDVYRQRLFQIRNNQTQALRDESYSRVAIVSWRCRPEISRYLFSIWSNGPACWKPPRRPSQWFHGTVSAFNNVEHSDVRTKLTLQSHHFEPTLQDLGCVAINRSCDKMIEPVLNKMDIDYCSKPLSQHSRCLWWKRW
jgi:hypothetical protein